MKSRMSGFSRGKLEAGRIELGLCTARYESKRRLYMCRLLSSSTFTNSPHSAVFEGDSSSGRVNHDVKLRMRARSVSSYLPRHAQWLIRRPAPELAREGAKERKMAWPLPAHHQEASASRSEPIAQPSASEHKCSVCLGLFTEPKVLPCCHTFCLQCLKKTASSAKTQGTVSCPQCRQSHPIPAGGLTEFLTDFIANYEVEVAGISSHKSGKITVCGECEGAGPVAHFCSDCQNYLCDECGVQLHKRLRTFRAHNVVPVSEINAATLQSCQVHFCGLHKGEILKLYCETCNQLVCRDCTLVEHRQHSYKFLADARKQLVTEMTSLKSDVQKKLSSLKLDLKEIEKIEIAATGHSQVVKADINLYFDGLAKSIEERRSALLKEAEEACQKDLKQVWADKEFHEVTISHVTAVFKLVDKARKCTSDSEMVLTALQSISQLKGIKEKEVGQ